MPITHMHPHYELYVCLDPVRQYTLVNCGNFTTDKACAILHAPYSMHKTEVYDRVDFERYVFYFGEQVIGSFPESILPLHTKMKEPAYFVQLDEAKVARLRTLTGLIDTYNDDENSKLLVFLLIFNEVFASGVEVQTFNIQDRLVYIYDVVKYIVNNISKPLSIDEIAKAFYISRDKLCSDFKKYTTVTTRQFIAELRTCYAKNMLKYTSLPIGELAVACGFLSEYYFYPFFRSHAGMTPLQYRKRYNVAQRSK